MNTRDTIALSQAIALEYERGRKALGLKRHRPLTRQSVERAELRLTANGTYSAKVGTK